MEVLMNRWILKKVIWINKYTRFQMCVSINVNSFLALKKVTCFVVCWYKTFANSLNPDQAWQNIGPDLESNCLTLYSDGIPERIYKKNVNFEKFSRRKKNHEKFSKSEELV